MLSESLLYLRLSVSVRHTIPLISVNEDFFILLEVGTAPNSKDYEFIEFILELMPIVLVSAQKCHISFSSCLVNNLYLNFIIFLYYCTSL